jgi:acyl-CoA synthetase (AMP-forming)/AMP-acid ligase II
LVRRCFLGTAPIDLATKRRFEEMFGRLLFENYALSETTFLTSETAASVNRRSEGSVGEALPYVSLSFRPVKDEESGLDAREILVKSPYLFDGYLDANGTVSKILDEESRLATGDVGYLNAQGTLVVSGRTRDIIKKGGYFIPLREIEILAESLDRVREAAAVPIRHNFYGESYVLFVVPREAEDAGLRDRVRRAIHERLDQYRWPEDVVAVDALPRTISGKIRKSAMSEQWRHQ